MGLDPRPAPVAPPDGLSAALRPHRASKDRRAPLHLGRRPGGSRPRSVRGLEHRHLEVCRT
ncbi:hypothetical protein [Lysobacter gummosus]|uniref:hypothetical protein n=1 Tax=Lysobacter gummosus TaxID=262324 RepID=UPI00363E8E07